MAVGGFDGAPPPPPGPVGGGGGARVVLVLPCNPCVRLGDYMRCSNWRIVWPVVWDLVLSGLVGLAAIDSCKPGIVPWGGEAELAWCDLHPSHAYKREPWRLPLLADAVARDLRDILSTSQAVVHYVNVKAYREALKRAAQALPWARGRIIDAGPPHPTIPSYRSTKNRQRLRATIIEVLAGAGG